jgi:hypothetical protein
MTIYVVETNGMSKHDFTVLEKQVLHLRELTTKHAAMVASVEEVARKIRGGQTWFTASEKGKIEAELKQAHMNVRQMCDNKLLQTEVEHTQRLVTSCAAYVAPVAQPVAQVSVEATVNKSFDVVREWEGGTVYVAGGEYSNSYEVRHYAFDDPKGEYQLWCNNKYDRDYTADWKKSAAGKEGDVAPKPEISPASSHEEREQKDEVDPPATVEDIFEDVRDLVRAVPDAGDQAKLAAEVDEKKSRFYFLYDDCRYRQNGQQAYQVITDFVNAIKQKLGENDQKSQKVASFLIYFTLEMCIMLQSYGDPNKSFDERIQERLKTYYKDEKCPMQLRLAKLKRHGSE